MARRSRNSVGIGSLIILIGMIFFLLFIMLIPTLPFEVTATEQAVMYFTSFLIVIAGIILVVKD